MTRVQKFWKSLGESNFYKVIGRLHTRIYRLTGGRVGHQTGALKNLLLTCTGRKSGKTYTCPLVYLEDRGRYVLIASGGGSDRHPMWYLNLQANPHATIEVGAKRIDVVATTASERERPQLWSAAVRMNPQFAVYESITSREIPVVVLTPVKDNPQQ